MLGRKQITIEVETDIDSSIADILCYLNGFIDAKGENWEHGWLQQSLESLRKLNVEIRKEL